MNIIKIISFSLAFLFVWIWQRFWLPERLRKIRDDIKFKTKEEIIKKTKEIQNSDRPDSDKVKIIEKITEYSVQEEFLDFRTEKLQYITAWVGWTEIIFFGLLTFFLIKNDPHLLERIYSFLIIFGGWIGIKIAVNYSLWSHHISGKAYFYVSLFGTLMNVLISILLGWFFSLMF